MSTSSSSFAPLVFTGLSSFSSDLQTILSRAVKIAQIPLTTYQNQQADLLQKKQLLISLSGSVADVGNAVASLGTLASANALTVSSSNAAKVSVSGAGATTATSYAITDITSIATAASETSASGYADSNVTPVSSTGDLQLVSGSNTYNIHLAPAKNNLAGLRDAINSLGSGISASILTTGTGPTPNYLSLSSAATGATTLQLKDTFPALVTATNTGTETSVNGYATPDSTAASGSGHVQLVVGGVALPTIDLAPGANNLNGLRDAINALGAGVTAQVVTGTGPTPYSLSITADAGTPTIQLNDVAQNLLTAQNQGTNAVFKLNGIAISRTTNSVNNVVPGIVFNILAKTDPSEAITLSLSTNRGTISSRLQTFVDKYNALVDQVNAQVGTAAGLLSGDFIIREIQSDTHQLASYNSASGGSIRSLASLGITLDNTGKASFDQTAFDALPDSQISDALGFLGSSTTGFGALAKKFQQLSDPAGGAIRVEQDGFDHTYKSLSTQIARVTDRVTALQASLNAKLQKADALLAQLQSRQSALTSSVQSLNFVLYGKQTGL